jgi:galactoside O-acetyltransferase
MAHYSSEELKDIGFKNFGMNVLISKDAKIYSPHKIVIGDNVRIDDFCILSGEIIIGSNVQLAPGVQLSAGAGKIILKDFTGIAFNTVVMASSDDYSGKTLVGVTVPDKYKTNKTVGEVVIGKHVIVGTLCTIMPNVSIGDGASVGAMSLVSKSLDAWGVYVGIPAKKIKERSRDLLLLEKDYKESH